MMRTKLLVLAALLSITSLVHGQSLSGVGVARNEFSNGRNSKWPLSTERLERHLKKHGDAVERIKTKSGTELLKTQCKKGDCKCPVEIEFCGDKKPCKLVCVLGHPGKRCSEQFTRLFLANGACHGRFFYREADQMLCYEDTIPADSSEAELEALLDQALQTVQENQPLWSETPKSAEASPAGTAIAAPAVPMPAAATAGNPSTPIAPALVRSPAPKNDDRTVSSAAERFSGLQVGGIAALLLLAAATCLLLAGFARRGAMLSERARQLADLDAKLHECRQRILDLQANVDQKTSC